MKVLLVSSYLPFPLTNGGSVRLYNLIKILSKYHEITLVCEMREYQNNTDIIEVKKFCKEIITVKRKKQWSIENILKAGFSNKSFLVTGHNNKEFSDKINRLLQGNSFDLIHVETFYIINNIPNTNIPILLVEHNIEYKVYEKFADNAPYLLRPFLYYDVLKLKRNEKSAWKRAVKIVTVSSIDKEEINTSNTYVIPNGVDLHKFRFKKASNKQYSSLARHMTLPKKEILFIGDFNWIQNRNTARWIIKDIWPFLLRAVEDEVKIKLRVVGRSIPSSIRALSIYDSIVFEENSPRDTYDIYKTADILLTPIAVGGGTSFKILEAMASGIPVVTTTLGAKGIEAADGQELMVGNDTQTIVEKTARLLRDNDIYRKIAISARKLIEKKFDWINIANDLDQLYKK